MYERAKCYPYAGYFEILYIFGFFWWFLRFFGKFSKLLRLLLKVTEVNIEHQKWPKMSTSSVKSFFVCEKGKPSTGAKSNFLSDIRHKDFRSDHPTWILKRGGLASSGQRLIFSIGRNKLIKFFSRKKKKKKIIC